MSTVLTVVTRLSAAIVRTHEVTQKCQCMYVNTVAKVIVKVVMTTVIPTHLVVYFTHNCHSEANVYNVSIYTSSNNGKTRMCDNSSNNNNSNSSNYYISHRFHHRHGNDVDSSLTAQCRTYTTKNHNRKCTKYDKADVHRVNVIKHSLTGINQIRGE